MYMYMYSTCVQCTCTVHVHGVSPQKPIKYGSKIRKSQKLKPHNEFLDKSPPQFFLLYNIPVSISQIFNIYFVGGGLALLVALVVATLPLGFGEDFTIPLVPGGLMDLPLAGAFPPPLARAAAGPVAMIWLSLAARASYSEPS